ncbi:MAG: hypothetical protein AUK20_01540 [Parcubacteria group bacterium CG2_30_45_37]|nr:MAG: hypothetical protein AUK20_01540 [Parcubacteria group bacterium CG2_30_45_37]
MFFFKKSKIIFFCLLVVLATQLTLPVLAASGYPVNPWGDEDKKNKIQEITGLDERDPRGIAASVINVALGFLGIIAVGLILYAGFKWMTAGGSEDKITEARKLLVAGVIGLIIILAAFAIANFVLTQLIMATA